MEEDLRSDSIHPRFLFLCILYALCASPSRVLKKGVRAKPAKDAKLAKETGCGGCEHAPGTQSARLPLPSAFIRVICGSSFAKQTATARRPSAKSRGAPATRGTSPFPPFPAAQARNGCARSGSGAG